VTVGVLDRYQLDAYPWERRDGETETQYRAFIAYRDLGPKRTLRAAACEHYGIAPADFDPKSGKMRTFERWSGANQWVIRAEAFDDWSQALADQDNAAAIIAMKTRHARIAEAAQSKVVEAIQKIDPSKMNLLQIVQVFDIAVRNERLARGVPASVDAIVGAEADQGRSEPISDEALMAKIKAWRASRDPENTIEAGEPGGEAPDGDLEP
jgi:hypothetical protein